MPIGDFFVLKGKASHFFYKNRIRPLRDIVSTVHDITSVATQFIKHFYLSQFFGAWEENNARRLVIDEDFVSKILSLVKGGTYQVRGNDNDARVVAAKQERVQLVDTYVSTPYFMNDAIANRDRFRAYSLSYTLAYSAQQLATAYENNIVAHFSSYVKKYVVTSLRRDAMLLLGYARYGAIPQAQRREIDSAATHAFNDIMDRRYGEDMVCGRPDFVVWIAGNRDLLMPPADVRFPRFDDHVDNDPFAFLPFMVRINRLLENLPSIDIEKYAANKLYSPLVLRTSYIPTHMCIDTTSLLHLFVDDVQHFKAWYSKRFDIDLVNLNSKASLASSFGTLVNRSDVTSEEESAHADRCWEYVGKLPPEALTQQREVRKRGLPKTVAPGGDQQPDSGDTKKKKKTKKEIVAAKVAIAASARRNPDDYETKALRFHRMMLTDGYSLSMLLTTAANVRGKVYGSRKQRMCMPRLDPDTSHRFEYLLLSQVDDPSGAAGSSSDQQPTRPIGYTKVSNDPGKCKILYMLDEDGNAVVHTQAKRERQCRHRQTRLKTLENKRATRFRGVTLTLGDETTIQDPTVEDIETRYLLECGLRTCFGDRYITRLNSRAAVAQYLKPFYEKIYFRSSKYAVYLATKSCNDKLVDEIRNTFGKEGKAIVIFWGNWGQRPNALRNGPSTPGIGLRRFIHRRIANDTRNGVTHYGFTVTVCEMKTSSVCNACGGDVDHIVNPAGEVLYRALRCQNDGCGRAWNRDKLGSKNIMMQSLHLLEHHSYHPWLVVNGA